jgi:hypothetical protein
MFVCYLYSSEKEDRSQSQMSSSSADTLGSTSDLSFTPTNKPSFPESIRGHRRSIDVSGKSVPPKTK